MIGAPETSSDHLLGRLVREQAWAARDEERTTGFWRTAAGRGRPSFCTIRGENDLPMRDIFEQLLSRPMRPQELTFFVATRTQASCFAGEANDKFETASFATRSCET